MGQLGAVHPDYQDHVEVYEKMEDAYGGARKIKAKRGRYLKPTPSMVLDGFGSVDTKAVGNVAYDGYINRANYPEYVKDGINGMIGLMHAKPCIFELPAELEFLRENASASGEGLDALLRKINFHQLKDARCALLVDMPAIASPTNKPYIALYDAKAIKNWNDDIYENGKQSLNMVVLDESGNKFDPLTFTYQNATKYRVLQIGEVLKEGATANAGIAYCQGVFEDEEYLANNMRPIVIKGQTINEIPITFITSQDVTTAVYDSPLLWLADQCISIYNSEADYRQNLYMQGQDTLVVKNAAGSSRTDSEDGIRIGAGAVIQVDGQNGDAKFIGVSANGLSEQRTAIENDRQEAAFKAGQFIGTKQAAQESGDAMQTRIAARTVTLSDIAEAGALGLQAALRTCAKWLGADPAKVVVRPNKDFSNVQISGQDLVQIVTARNLGAPISKQSIHEYCVRNGLTVLTFDAEMAIVKKELPGEVPPLTEQVDTSTGRTNMANSDTPDDPTPTEAKTNVDSRA